MLGLKIAVIKKGRKFNDKDELTAFMSRLMKNKCVDIIRKRTTKKSISTIDISEIKKPPTEELFKDEINKEIMECIETLPQANQKIILLKYYDRHTMKEIAKMLEINFNTLKKKLGKILLDLKPCLERKKIYFVNK